MKTILAIVLTVVFSVTWAQSNSAIIDTEQMQQAVARGAIIWDVRGEKSYLEGHLPGAINVGEIGSVLRDPNKEDYIATEQIQKIFNAAGLDVNQEIENAEENEYFNGPDSPKSVVPGNYGGKKRSKKSRKSRKMRGGARFGTGVGANNSDPNYSIFNTRALSLFPYKPN